jgi:hypothetical protein
MCGPRCHSKEWGEKLVGGGGVVRVTEDSVVGPRQSMLA